MPARVGCNDARDHPPPVQHTPGVSGGCLHRRLCLQGWGSNWCPYSTRCETAVRPRARTDCGGRLFTAKLGVVVHYLPHQLLDDRPRHTLQRSEARSRGSVASTVGRVQRFKARSLKLASNRANRHTLKAAPAAAILVSESGAAHARLILMFLQTRGRPARTSCTPIHRFRLRCGVIERP
jgi:hypothetical protein